MNKKETQRNNYKHLKRNGSHNRITIQKNISHVNKQILLKSGTSSELYVG